MSAFQSDSEFQTQPAPDEAARPWWRVALILAASSVSFPTILTGVDLARAATPTNFYLGLAGGGVVLTIIATLMGVIGSRTRLSSYMLANRAFGEHGAACLNALFALSLVGWFGVNIELFADAARALLAVLVGYHGAIWPLELGAGALMTATTALGLRAIDRLSLWMTPLMTLIVMELFARAFGVTTAGEAGRRILGHALSAGEVITVVVGGVVVGAVTMPDFCRFLRRPAEVVAVSVCAYLLSASFVMLAGGFAGLAVPEGDALAAMRALGMGAAAFLLVFGGTWTINALNLYSMALSVSTLRPLRASHAMLTIIGGVIGTAAAFAGLAEHFVEFLTYLSIAFMPVSGVIVADFYLASPSLRPPRWAPFASWAVGMLAGVLAMQQIITVTHVAACDALLASVLTQAALCRAGKKQTDPAGG